MDKDKVMSLAQLARLDISDTEAENLSREFEAILGYVGEVKNVTKNSQPTTDSYVVKNVMRGDIEAHESGIYTEKILAEAPRTEGGYIKVKKIL